MEDAQALKAAATSKIVDLTKALLGESDPELGHFAKDSYDALEEAYGTPELKAQFAQKISDLGRKLVADFRQSMAEPLEAPRDTGPRRRVVPRPSVFDSFMTARFFVRGFPHGWGTPLLKTELS